MINVKRKIIEMEQKIYKCVSLFGNILNWQNINF